MKRKAKPKVNAKVDFKNHFIRYAILTVWNRYKLMLCQKYLYGCHLKKHLIEEK